MSFTKEHENFKTFSRVLELEGKLTKTNQTVKTILEENKILKQELKDAIFAINLLEKQIASIRARVNRKDLKEIPEYIAKEIMFITVKRIEEVLNNALEENTFVQNLLPKI